MPYASHRSPPPMASVSSSSTEARRDYMGIPTPVDSTHTSLGGYVPRPSPTLPLMSLEMNNMPTTSTQAVDNDYYNDSSGVCHGAAHLQHAELNTPEIDTSKQFKFATHSDFDPTMPDDDLMDALFAAQSEDSGCGEPRVRRTEDLNSVPVSSNASQHPEFFNEQLDVGFGQSSVAEPHVPMQASAVKVVADEPCTTSFSLAPKFSYQQAQSPALKNTTSLSHASQCDTISQENVKKSFSTYGNSINMSTEPHGSFMKSSPSINQQFSVECKKEVTVALGSMSSSDMYVGNIHPTDLCSPVDCGSFDSPVDFSPNMCFGGPFALPSVGTETHGNRAQAIIGLHNRDDTFLYEHEYAKATLKNVNEIPEDLFKFTETINDDGMDFPMLAENEDVSANVDQSMTLGANLDHFGLLSSSQEPGSLLRAAPEDEQNLLNSHQMLHHSGNNLNHLDVNPTHRLDFLEQKSSSSHTSEKLPAHSDTRDLNHTQLGAGTLGYCTTLPNNPLGIQAPKRDVLHNSPDTTSLRPLIALKPNGKALDGGELMMKLQHHVNVTAQNVSGVSATKFCPNFHTNPDEVLHYGAAAQSQLQVRPTKPSGFTFDFDPELNVTFEAPPQQQQRPVIKVSVLKNTAGLRAAQKPVKRLATQSFNQSLSIRTKKFRLVPRPGSGKCVAVPTSAVLAPEGTSPNACSTVAETVQTGSQAAGSSGSSINANRTVTIVRPFDSLVNKVDVKPASASVTSSSPCFVILQSGSNLFGQESSQLLINRSRDIRDLTDSESGPFNASTLNSSSQGQPLFSVHAPNSVSGSPAIFVRPMAKLPVSSASVLTSTSVSEPLSTTSKPIFLPSIVASSQHDSAVAGPSNVRINTGSETASTSKNTKSSLPAYHTNDSDPPYEPEESDQGAKRETTGGSGIIVGFSRLPRSAQQALDAEKYRKNLQANNLASTKSRLKRKQALLKLKDKRVEQSELNAKLQAEFLELKKRYDIMNSIAIGRPCCHVKKWEDGGFSSII